MDKPYDIYLSGDYLANNPTWDQEDSEWKAGQVLKILDKNQLIPNSIVEVGCGAGGVLASIHHAMPETKCVGFEIAPDASKFWDSYKSSGIEFNVGDFLKENTREFDVLLLLDVLEHVPNPFDFLPSLRGRAKYFIFHIPLDLSSLSVAREDPLLQVRKKVGHIHYFTKGLALSLIQESGFQILDWFYTGAAFTTPKKTWKSRLAALPRYFISRINRDLSVRMLGGETLIVLAITMPSQDE